MKYEKVKPLHEAALNESGHETTMPYTKTTTRNNKNRSHNVMWFNPSCSQNVKINIGNTFLKLIKKHFL